MPEFYVIFARKIVFPDFLEGGGRQMLPDPVYTLMVTANWYIYIHRLYGHTEFGPPN